MLHAAARLSGTSCTQQTLHHVNHPSHLIAGAEYEAALRKQHQALNPRTSWATRKAKQQEQKKRRGEDSEEDEEDAEEAEVAAEAEALLARAGGLTERRAGGASRRLPAGQIETTRLKDANQHGPSEAVVQAVQFHPNGQVCATGSRAQGREEGRGHMRKGKVQGRCG